MPHMLLTAKLNAYGFRLKASKLMNNSQGNQKDSRFGVKTYFFQNISECSFSYLNDIDIAYYTDVNTLLKHVAALMLLSII